VQALALVLAHGGCAGQIGGEASGMPSGTPDAGVSGAPDAGVSGAPDAGVSGTPDAGPDTGRAVKTVFVILMENHNWSQLAGSSAAPYLNGTLLPKAAHATRYYNPPGLHPSLPNYLWLEGGQAFGVTDDGSPATHPLASHAHLAALLDAAHVSWRAYEEDISGTVCPLTGVRSYAPRHNPFVYFTDETGGGRADDPGCIAHNRPLPELTADLAAGSVARYNFITPNLCHDMHDSCAPTSSPIRQGDDFLAEWVPRIEASPSFADGGVLFITWDEAASGDGPIGMIVLGAATRGGGYAGSVRYTHSSLLRTLEIIFDVGPYLGDAANAADLSDLFATFP
jgi:hypothetical protein